MDHTRAARFTAGGPSREINRTMAVLDLPARIALKLRIKKHAHRLKRGKQIRRTRIADEKRLGKRAQRAALRFIKAKFAGKQGKNYKNLTPAAKVQVDRIIAGKKAPLKAIARRMLPKTRAADRERVGSVRGK